MKEYTLGSSKYAVPSPVRRQWTQMSAIETGNKAITHRNLDGYLVALGGLEHFLNYVKSSTNSQTVADIGAGQAIAINQLAQHPLGGGLSYMATNIAAPRLQARQSRIPYLRTGAETLSCIEDKSIGGAMAAYSIIFSVSPEMVVSAFDRVLESGGAVKTNIVVSNAGRYIPPSQAELQPAFEERGYDVAMDTQIGALVAIKPGASPIVSAEELLQADMQALDSQRQAVADIYI